MSANILIVLHFDVNTIVLINISYHYHRELNVTKTKQM